MPTYQIGHETVRVSRKGEVRGTSEDVHYRYDVHAVTSGIRTWITVPSYWDEDCVLSTALEAVAYELGEGDRADWWTLYSRDIDSYEHPDTAAMYRVSSVSHYRTRPHSIDSRGETYPTIRDAVRAFSRSWYSPGDVMDLFPNDSDKPTHRLVAGPRGGIRVEKF